MSALVPATREALEGLPADVAPTLLGGELRVTTASGVGPSKAGAPVSRMLFASPS